MRVGRFKRKFSTSSDDRKSVPPPSPKPGPVCDNTSVQSWEIVKSRTPVKKNIENLKDFACIIKGCIFCANEHFIYKVKIDTFSQRNCKYFFTNFNWCGKCQICDRNILQYFITINQYFTSFHHYYLWFLWYGYAKSMQAELHEYE